ncbi:MAG: 30S ribosomal protein S12 methylthiotransferase RimO [Ruminococcaceae bacterium]|nr:30S ribosomal protein S12 methylthiotransferase RimO [Oscillospiraceae bacterium]MBR3596561.1 30S ribosomal protein S12 methylthiotransferase RimO [Clostridia bacterium]
MHEKIGFISLGCPKNQVDSELMLSKLDNAGFEIIDTAFGADVVIINTCGFIEAAKQEAIDNILEMVQLKEDGELGKIIVIGCLAERYRDEILNEIPEVDAVGGLGINGDIVDFVNEVLKGSTSSSYPEKEKLPLCGQRILTTPSHWAYLKISDGCSNCCTYCAIPSIRGPFRSRTKEDIILEAKALASSGVKELILIAQDTTRYGDDLYGKPVLHELLYELNKINGIEWIRLLYCYPDRLSDELLKAMTECEKVLHYIDLPLQHASGKILKAMNRHGDEISLLELTEKIRSYMPDCIIRTTFITGFPGETEEDFEILSDFVNKAEFDRLGCFSYSPEEGTPAEKLPDRVEPETAVSRGEAIMSQQYGIFSRKLENLLGTVQKCIIEDYDGYSDSYSGRTWMDAPEIDSGITVVSDRELAVGEFTDVLITAVNEYDLIGTTDF